MKKRIIQWASGNVTVELSPSDGYKYITDGNTYSTNVLLAKDADEANWNDTNDDPPTPEEEITDTEALNIVTGKE